MPRRKTTYTEWRTNPDKEQCARRIEAKDLEIRAAGEGTPGTLVGFAAVFDQETELFPGLTEVFAPGAFAESLRRGDDVRAFDSHADNAIIGRRAAGTLRLEEDATGLRAEIDLPDTTVAHDLAENIRAGNLDGMSVGFRARQTEWTFTEEEGENDSRRIIAADLVEVSVVAFPAYAGTTVAMRGVDGLREDAARLKREAGLTAPGDKPPRPSASAKTLRLRARARDLERSKARDKRLLRAAK